MQIFKQILDLDLKNHFIEIIFGSCCMFLYSFLHRRINMKKKIQLLLLFFSLFNFLSAQVQGEVWYKPPLLPISISWGSEDGLSIKAEQSISTPIGTFGLEVSGNLNKKDQNTIVVPATNNKPIYIKVPKYIERTKIIEKPVLQIKTIEKTITEIVEKKTYTIELLGYKGKLSQEFVINGVDILMVEVEGKTKIEATEGRIIIDVSEGYVSSIKFRGSSLSEEDMTDKIIKLCQKYNKVYNRAVIAKQKDISEKYYVTERLQTSGGEQAKRVLKERVIKEDYLEALGFILPSTFEGFEKYKINFNNQRDLMVKYYIDDFNNSVIATYGQLLITKNGIGIPIMLPVYKKTLLGSEKLDHMKFQYKFLKWNEFIGITFNKPDGSLYKIVGRSPYSSYFEVEMSKFVRDGFTNVELIQFFRELNALFTENIN